MIATSTWISALGVAIPLVVVFGIFVVSPLAHRGAWRESRSGAAERSRQVDETQARILDEIRGLRAQLDEIQRVLSAVE
jgi:hypothetical protein